MIHLAANVHHWHMVSAMTSIKLMFTESIIPLSAAGIAGTALLATFLGTRLLRIDFFNNLSIPLAGVGLLGFELRRLTRRRALRLAIEIASTIVVAAAVLMWLGSR